MARISVIVPIFNASAYIRQCIESIIYQTMHDIEIICIDDCSTDDSWNIVKSFAQHDPRIKIFKNSRNMDIADTRNQGLKHSRGKYIMWCDSDDWFEPEICQRLYDAITQNKCDMAMCGTNIIYESDSDLKRSDAEYFQVPDCTSMPVTDENNLNVVLWNKIFRRDIIERYDIKFPSKLRYEDEFFFRAYLCHSENIAFVPHKLYNYRRNSGSIMNKTFEKKADYGIDILKIVIKYQNYLQSHNLYDIKYDAFWQHTFLPAVKSALSRANNRYATTQVFNLACDFIETKYTRPVFDWHVNRGVEIIRNKTLTHIPRKYLWGLVKYINNEIKTEWSFCALSIYKKKYSNNAVKYHLFGIPVLTKRL